MVTCFSLYIFIHCIVFVSTVDLSSLGFWSPVSYHHNVPVTCYSPTRLIYFAPHVQSVRLSGCAIAFLLSSLVGAAEAGFCLLATSRWFRAIQRSCVLVQPACPTAPKDRARLKRVFIFHLLEYDASGVTLLPPLTLATRITPHKWFSRCSEILI